MAMKKLDAKKDGLIVSHRQNNPDAESDITRFGLMRTTLRGEYERTIELFERVYRDKGLYFAIALLYDSGYKAEDLRNMMTVMEDSHNRGHYIKIKK